MNFLAISVTLILQGSLVKIFIMDSILPIAAQALITENLLTTINAHDYYQASLEQNLGFVDYLTKFSNFKPRKIALVLAKYLKVNFVDLDEFIFSNEIFELTAHGFINKHQVLPLYIQDTSLYLAFADPTNKLFEETKIYFDYNLVFVVVEVNKLVASLSKFTKLKNFDDGALRKLVVASNSAKAKDAESQPVPVHDDLNSDSTKQFVSAVEFSKRSNNDLVKYTTQRNLAALNHKVFAESFKDNALEFTNIDINQSNTIFFTDPVVKLVNTIISVAYENEASDVHIEPFVNNYRVRYRIDGILYNYLNLEIAVAKRICSRLKILANLNIIEHRLPQDGRFSFNIDSNNFFNIFAENCKAHDDIEGERGGGSLVDLNLQQNNISVDCRISICPTLDGEKIVIRFLNKINGINLDIESLQFSTRDKLVFSEALTYSQGLILITGPTGSGKSTTLYTALSHLNSDKLNIVSIEDPVEMRIKGINQIQVNAKFGLEFANVLRNTLRQDPDIIMVGEIRDLETAQIAIQAAQTGHLVLASLHTNSAAQTITRLINLGIPIYNLISSLRLIVAQRLVRKLCIYCKNMSLTNVCKQCVAGFKGRVGVYEVMPISKNLITMLTMNNFNEDDITNLACQEGMLTLKNAGLGLVTKGITSFEEIKRVIEV